MKATQLSFRRVEKKYLLTREQYDEITKEFALDLNCTVEGGVVARACTSWATRPENVDRFIEALKRMR